HPGVDEAVQLGHGVGLGGDDLDGATCGVAAVQGALGALENFHPLGVKQAVDGAVGAGQVDIVVVPAHGGVGGDQVVALHLAADGGLGHGAVVGGGGLDKYTGGERRQVVGVGEVEGGEIIGAEVADGYRHVLQGLFLLAGGDHDFFQA